MNTSKLKTSKKTFCPEKQLFAVTPRDDSNKAVVMSLAEKAGIKWACKGHENFRLYFPCTLSIWQNFYKKIEFLCEPSVVPCPRSLAKQIFRNLKYTINHSQNPLLATRASLILKYAIDSARDSATAAAEIVNVNKKEKAPLGMQTNITAAARKTKPSVLRIQNFFTKIRGYFSPLRQSKIYPRKSKAG